LPATSSPLDHSGRACRLRAPRYLLAALALDHGKVLPALQVEPELRVVAEMTAEGAIKQDTLSTMVSHFHFSYRRKVSCHSGK